MEMRTGEDTSLAAPITRRKLSESVADRIQCMITEGTLKKGARLPSEWALAKQFAVGRSSVREALLLLQARGLISILHGVGAFVGGDATALSTQMSDFLLLDNCTVPELFEVRHALESHAVTLAAQRITPAQAKRLQDILQRFTKEGLSDAEHVELDGLLHKEFVIAAQNTLFLRIYDIIQPLFLTYSTRIVAVPGSRTSAYRGHVEIVSAITSGHPRSARAALTRHLEESEREVSEHLARIETDTNAQQSRARSSAHDASLPTDTQ